MGPKSGRRDSLPRDALTGPPMSNQMSIEKAPSVLFFGRYGCSWSERILNLLKDQAGQVEYFESRERGEIPPGTILNWSGDLIFCFRSLHILSAQQIKRATLGAINFHPGPPEYPGSGCTNWALLNSEKIYGVTAHLMSERVDAGPILAVRRFEILESDNIETLLEKTHDRLGELAISLIENILALDERGRRALLAATTAEKWSGKSRPIRDLDELREVPVDISADELQIRIRALQVAKFPLYVKVAGRVFELEGT